MKSSINEKSPAKEPAYPRLEKFIESGAGPFVILKVNSSAGIVVWTENRTRPLGYVDGWRFSSDFELFDGEIILSN